MPLKGSRGRSTPGSGDAMRGPLGVNVVGYLDRTSGLGERARQLVAVLRAGGLDVAEWPLDTTASPSSQAIGTGAAGRAAPTACHDVTIAVVTAAELPAVAEVVARPFAAGVVIGYWFWEAESVPDDHQRAIALVDEIWAPTRFVHDAYAAVTDVPVRVVPLPIPCPVVGDATRELLGLDDRFTFLVSFDHLSVMERKNPIGAIEAFISAFPPDDDSVRLVVKTLNGELRPLAAARLRRAAATDARVDIVDRHLTDDEQAALVAHADVLVSLHRSEGLGLQPAAAMWLGKPVIASRYAGTLDLMDDESAALVDVRMVPITNADGAYPAAGCWADPDLDQAASAMRRLVVDEEYRTALVAAALERRRAAPDTAGAAAAVIELVAGVEQRLGRVRPMSADTGAGQSHDSAHESPASPVRRVARAATAPLRGYFNQHFEMLKDEVRTQRVGVDLSSIAPLLADLDASITEASLHQARVLARVRSDVEALDARLVELERMVARLAEVVAASTVREHEPIR